MIDPNDPNRPLFVLASSPHMAFSWAAAEDIPRSRIRPITSGHDLQRVRGLNSVTYWVHETWTEAPLRVIHETQHRFAWIRGTGGTVQTLTRPEQLDPYRDHKPPVSSAMSEDDFKQRVIDTAKTHGWMVVHYRPAKTRKGYRTPLQGDKGCPDLILARDSVVLLAELKTDTGRVTPEQKQWLYHLGVYGCVWRPRDWPEIQDRLK